MEQKLRFGLDLGLLASQKKKIGPFSWAKINELKTL
jgi:hypothetical protein